MAKVDERLRVSMEKLAETYASPPALVDAWWAEAQLSTCKGGLGVGGHEESSAACYVASIFACWPRLQAASVPFRATATAVCS